MKAAGTNLSPVQHPLPDSAGGCWKVKVVGFLSLEAVGSPYKDGGRATCCPHTCAVSWARGPGSALGPPRNGGGKLGHSSAPLTPHGSSGKSTWLSLLSWLEGPVEPWLPQWQTGNRSAGGWEHKHGTPSSELKVQQLLETRFPW